VLPWALLVVGSVASLAANVAVAQPTVAGRVIAAWPSFALIGAYELLMRQVRRGAAGRSRPQDTKLDHGPQGDRTVLEEIRDHGNLPLVRVLGRGRPSARVLPRIFGGRRGSGLWPTEQRMGRFPVGVRSPTATAVVSDGAAWLNAQASQVNSPCPACDCWISSHRALIAACTESEHPRDRQLQCPSSLPNICVLALSRF
jgi:hypothetical protein